MLYVPLSNPWRPFIWRWWKHYLDPRTYWDTLVVWHQRATRGWAYCDIWSLDGYVCDVLIPALEHLKRTKHGVPCPDDAVFEEDGYSTSEEEFARWQKDFDAELDAMIAGFKAATALTDLTSPSLWDGDRLNVSAYDQWRNEQEAIRNRGFDAFKKHFLALWD